MTNQVLDDVLKDCNITRDDIQAAWFSNAMWGLYSFQHSIRASASTTRDQKLSKPNKLSPVLDSESFKGNRYPLYTNAHMNMKNIVESSFSATATRTCAITHTNRICNGNGATSVTFHSARKRPRVDLDALICWNEFVGIVSFKMLGVLFYLHFLERK